MKTFAEKLAQLKTIKDQMPQSVQSSISSSLNAHNTEITIDSIFTVIFGLGGLMGVDIAETSAFPFV
jgi:hypothetical protein